jgi:hypothetical protein
MNILVLMFALLGHAQDVAEELAFSDLGKHP